MAGAETFIEQPILSELIREAEAGSSLTAAEWIPKALRQRPSASADGSRNATGESAESDALFAGYIPKTALGKKLLELRKRYAEAGGKFLNREELDKEIAQRRLGYPL